MNSKHYFESLRSQFEKNLDKAILQKYPMQSLLAQTLPSPPSKDENLNTLNTLSSEGGVAEMASTTQGFGRPPKQQKSVRFQVYKATTLNSIKTLRDSRFQAIENFSRERSNSREESVNRQRSSQSGPLLQQIRESAPSSVNQTREEEYKENTFGAQPLKEVLSQISQLSEHSQLANPFDLSDHKLQESLGASFQKLTREHSPLPLPANVSKLNNLLESGLSQVLKRAQDQQSLLQTSGLSEKVGTCYSDKVQTDKQGLTMDLLRSSLANQFAVEQELQNQRDEQEDIKRQKIKNIENLFQAVANYRSVSNRNIQKQSLATIQHYIFDTELKIDQIQERTKQNIQGRALRLWKLGQKEQRVHAKLKDLAIQVRQFRLREQKKLILAKIKKILYIERKWLQNVRKEFKLGKLDLIWAEWQLFVKCQKVKRLRKRNTQFAWMRQLKFDTERNLKLCAKQGQKRLFRQTQICFTALRNNIEVNKEKNFKKALAHEFWKRRLTGCSLSLFKENVARMLTIKGDVFLKKAQLQKDEFFTVGIRKQSGYSQQESNKKALVTLTKSEVINVNLVD